jgi:hypothetical protein
LRVMTFARRVNSAKIFNDNLFNGGRVAKRNRRAKSFLD